MMGNKPDLPPEVERLVDEFAKRVVKIICSGPARCRSKMASYLAFETNMSVEDAIAALGASPVEPPFQDRFDCRSAGFSRHDGMALPWPGEAADGGLGSIRYH